jgi:hypothetical protein
MARVDKDSAQNLMSSRDREEIQSSLCGNDSTQWIFRPDSRAYYETPEQDPFDNRHGAIVSRRTLRNAKRADNDDDQLQTIHLSSAISVSKIAKGQLADNRPC